MPIAAIDTLASLISASSVSTVQELFSLLEGAAEELKKASFNPISLASGTQLLLRFLTIQRLSPDQSFDEFKGELVKRAREFVEGSGRCRDIIAAHITTFVKDDSVSNHHRADLPALVSVADSFGGRTCGHRLSWSTLTRYAGRATASTAATCSVRVGANGDAILCVQRVVVQALLYAAQTLKKRFRVYVTESRPVRSALAGLPLARRSAANSCSLPNPQFGLGLKTHALLTAAGIESVVVLDSAVAYVMAKVSSVASRGRWYATREVECSPFWSSFAGRLLHRRS